MTPLLNAIAVAVAVFMSAAVYVKGPTIESKWDRIVAELRRYELGCPDPDNRKGNS